MTDVVTADVEKKLPVIELVRCDDWYVLIIDGEIYSEGHRLRGNEALEIMNDMMLIEYSEQYFDGEENPDMESYLAKFRTVEVKDGE